MHAARVRAVWIWLLFGSWMPLSQATDQPVEINSASLAQLEALGGIGTALAARAIEERARHPFTDWQDVQRRLKGIGPKVAARLSDQGLTVNGMRYTTPAPGASSGR